MGVVCLAGRPALAQTVTTETPAISVDCLTLGTDPEAAIEARIRAELAWSPLRGAQIQVSCGDHAGTVTLQVEGAPPRRKEIVVSDDPATAVDAVIAAVDALRRERASPSAAPPPEAPPAVAPSRTTTDHEDLPSQRARRGFRLGVTAGASGELWHGAIHGAAGPRIGLCFETRSGWSSELGASVVWGWTASSGVHAQLLRGTWTVGYSPVPAFGMVLGGEAIDLVADSSSGQLHELSGVTAGGIAGLRFRARWGAITIAAGPQLEVLALPLSVQVAGREVFGVSRFVGSLVTEIEGDFLR